MRMTSLICGKGCRRYPAIESWGRAVTGTRRRILNIALRSVRKKPQVKIMWLGHGPENQWPSSLFHQAVDKAIDEDRDFHKGYLPQMTDTEIRHSYLLVLLGVADPAGVA